MAHMHLHRVALVRVIAEKRLTPRILTVLTDAGANGYTIYDAAGAGAHGERSGASFDTTNVVIEVLTSEQDGMLMLERVETEFLPGAALIAYIQNVRTLRKSKFS